MSSQHKGADNRLATVKTGSVVDFVTFLRELDAAGNKGIPTIVTTPPEPALLPPVQSQPTTPTSSTSSSLTSPTTSPRGSRTNDKHKKRKSSSQASLTSTNSRKANISTTRMSEETTEEEETEAEMDLLSFLRQSSALAPVKSSATISAQTHPIKTSRSDSAVTPNKTDDEEMDLWGFLRSTEDIKVQPVASNHTKSSKGASLSIPKLSKKSNATLRRISVFTNLTKTKRETSSAAPLSQKTARDEPINVADVRCLDLVRSSFFLSFFYYCFGLVLLLVGWTS